MHAWPDDARLFATIAANVLLLAGAWRFARRHNARFVVALPDALLIWLAAQYVITGTLGLLGAMWPEWMLLIGAIVGVVLYRSGATGRTRPVPRTDHGLSTTRATRNEARIALLAFAFVVAYGIACCVNQRVVPQLATDVIVYHYAAAANWVQAGRIFPVDFWYWLPDNTYSPLAGSVWIAWWLAPIGNDSLARFVQLPTWLLLMASLLRLMRDLRVPTLVASLVAVAIVVARPFISQMLIAKDDLAVAALAVTLLSSLHARRLRERGAAVRLALALGLLMSVKYPAALAVPAIAPAILFARWKRVGWGRLALAALVAIAFVAPWLIRNALLTGNPVFPVASGGTSYLPDPNLRSLAGVYQTLAGSHFALPIVLWSLLLVGTLATAWLRRHSLARDGVMLSLIVGPVCSVALLVGFFPFSEIRYLFTAVAVGMTCVGVALSRVPNRTASALLAIGVLSASLLTSFTVGRWGDVALFAGSGIVTIAVLGIILRLPQLWRRVTLAVTTLGAAIAIYVGWTAYLRHPDVGYTRSTDEGWIVRYGPIAQMWSLVRTHVPPGSRIAYANTPTIWPLFGFDLQYRVVYAPVRPGVAHLYDLPRVKERVPARDEYIVATGHLTEGADEATWLANLARLRADYLFIAKRESSPNPPELAFVARNPSRFEKMSENDEAVVYRIRH